MYKIIELRKFESIYGSPLYLFKEEEFISNYILFKNCFDKYYSKYKLSYSYKTNYTPAICKIVKEMGGFAEVVSDMEYSVAKAIGYLPNQIIYNGPCKGYLGKESLLNGGIINVDNLDELDNIYQIAKENQESRLEIGLRININIGQSFISRFGIDSDSPDLDKAFNDVSHIKNLEIVGLHCHVGQSRSIEAWKKRAAIMLSIADKYFISKPPKYIDLGSGMFANMEPSLAKQFGDYIPTFDDYAKAVAQPFAEHYKYLSDKNKPILFTEPGTTLINSYIDFIGKVTSIKTIKGHTFVIINGSKDNLGDICKMKHLPITVIPNSSKRTALNNASIVGYTCLEHDIVYSDFSGELGVGDYIIFGNVGGYSIVSKPPFILWNCPMITKKRDGTFEIIKHGEKFDDLFRTYKI